MTMHQTIGAGLLAVSGMMLPGRALIAQITDSACAASTACAAVTKFSALVSDFRESTSGNYRLTAATVRFHNTSDAPLILGYVSGSGVVVDDQGNRYQVGGNTGVRGIGQIANNTFDPKFTLQPGEWSDARFEFVWQPTRGAIYGTSYEIDLAIREIDPVGTDQYRLGREHALHFSGLGEAGAAPPAPTASAPVQVTDPCVDRPGCHFASAFVAEVARVTRSVRDPYNDQIIEVTVRFTNLTTDKLILGYTSGSSVIVDDVGNRYYWGRAGTVDQSASGIGLVTGRSADPSFALAPGESRNATFKLWFRAGRKQVGTRYTFDVTVEQLEILPSQQIRTLREYAIGFQDLAVGSGSKNNALDNLVGSLLQSAGVKKP